MEFRTKNTIACWLLPQRNIADGPPNCKIADNDGMPFFRAFLVNAPSNLLLNLNVNINWLTRHKAFDRIQNHFDEKTSRERKKHDDHFNDLKYPSVSMYYTEFTRNPSFWCKCTQMLDQNKTWRRSDRKSLIFFFAFRENVIPVGQKNKTLICHCKWYLRVRQCQIKVYSMRAQ